MTVLVCGYYKSPPNLGDHLFSHAFKLLFPKLDLRFTDHISAAMLHDVSTVFFGGGSFLDGEPNITPEALTFLQNKTIMYIGIGAETNIHPIHEQLMRSAKLIAIRSNDLDKIKQINPNTIAIPDLVYALRNQTAKAYKIDRSVLVLPNIAVVPFWDEPHWKHLHFEAFKMEMAQTLDILIEDNYVVDFYAMSQAPEEHDNWAAIELINKMRHKPRLHIHTCTDVGSITELLSQYSVIITQRYHGAVLAEMSDAPYLCIHHHDKLRHTSFDLGRFLPYFGISKGKLLQEVDFLTGKECHLPIDTDMFKELVSRVECAMLE